jgi:hypothetical protein
VSALAEALLVAQRQAIGALSKAYIAGAFEDDGEAGLIANLDRLGATDAVDQSYLRECLDTLRTWGAPSPQANGKPDPANEPASDRQTAYIKSLADDRNLIAPDGPLTKEQASKVIEQLKAGTYNPDEWVAPF